MLMNAKLRAARWEKWREQPHLFLERQSGGGERKSQRGKKKCREHPHLFLECQYPNTLSGSAGEVPTHDIKFSKMSKNDVSVGTEPVRTGSVTVVKPLACTPLACEDCSLESALRVGNAAGVAGVVGVEVVVII
jgi:hypothetical protein